MLRERWLFGRRAASFTLQWHLTNACDLHCLHCYDRSPLAPLRREEARRVLEELTAFCARRGVRGQVCFTGGNPMLHPDFLELYQAAARSGFRLSILGNPAPRERIEELVAIRRPLYYQVSLEGLEEHNDRIRGPGSFARTLAFLELLREERVRAHVMLTLTKDNLDQVLPLGERLRGLARRFTYNRLAQVGEGAALASPAREEYESFAQRYLAAARTNPVLGFKDGLLNIARRRRRLPLFGGCTGHGCGAAFNFVALLPDGEVHACRKLPSPLGSLRTSTLEELWESAEARRYRAGSRACRGCPLRARCGGCYAVAYGHGQDIFSARDPHCFRE